MKSMHTLIVLTVAIFGLAFAYPAEQQEQQPLPQDLTPQASEPVEVMKLVPVPEEAAEVPEPLNVDGQRTKRHLGFGGVGLGVGVGLVGGGFGGYPGFGYGYPGYGYGGGFYPGYGYGGYRYRYGYGGGFGYPYFY